MTIELYMNNKWCKVEKQATILYYKTDATMKILNMLKVDDIVNITDLVEFHSNDAITLPELISQYSAFKILDSVTDIVTDIEKENNIKFSTNEVRINMKG